MACHHMTYLRCDGGCELLPSPAFRTESVISSRNALAKSLACNRNASDSYERIVATSQTMLRLVAGKCFLRVEHQNCL